MGRSFVFLAPMAAYLSDELSDEQPLWLLIFSTTRAGSMKNREISWCQLANFCVNFDDLNPPRCRDDDP
jgi:hypothetical protein